MYILILILFKGGQWEEDSMNTLSSFCLSPPVVVPQGDKLPSHQPSHYQHV